MHVLIVADDLTGALDSAVPFAAGGLRTVAARRPEDVAAALRLRPDVLAVSTASREGGRTAARLAVEAVAEAVGTLPPVVFKKVDSRLKGHAGEEVAALARKIAARKIGAGKAGLGRALVAPAIPRQGRFVAGGKVVGTGVEAPIDVAAVFAGSGLRLQVPDTAGEAELDAALEKALAGEAPLLVGAAGLAGALARRLAPHGGTAGVPKLAGPVLFAIGSRDPITLAQVAHLHAAGAVAAEEAPEGACPPALHSGIPRLLRLAAVEGKAFDVDAAGARFAEGVAQLVGSGAFPTLFACGGETADAVLGALGAGVLAVEGEVLPGVPVSTMVGAGRCAQLVTKSGGFGGEDALLAVVEAAGGLRKNSA